jgi:hypothetical protein
MSAEVIPVANIQSAGLWYHRDVFELFEEEGLTDHLTPKPYFLFDVAVPEARREAITRRIQQDLSPQDAADLLAFLQYMEWDASFLFLG